MMPIHRGVGMSTLSLNIEMKGKQAVIIGGGAVALRKLRTLLLAGASVRLVAVMVCPEITALKDSGALAVRVGSYCAADLENSFLVVAATDDPRINEQVCSDARGRGILVVVADNPRRGDCTFPAILQRGDLEVAVSTAGRAPAFAVAVRDCIAKHIGTEYGTILDLLAEEREKLLTNRSSNTYNTQVLRSLARRLITELTERKDPLP